MNKPERLAFTGLGFPQCPLWLIIPLMSPKLSQQLLNMFSL